MSSDYATGKIREKGRLPALSWGKRKKEGEETMKEEKREGTKIPPFAKRPPRSLPEQRKTKGG